MRITVIGAANVDIFTKSKAKIIHGDSNPAAVNMTPGGVARNIAENLSRLGAEVNFITAIGDDTFGGFLRERCSRSGINTEAWLIRQDMNTSVYMAALDQDGELYAAFNATLILESIKREELEPYKAMIRQSDLLVVDTNLTECAIEAALDIAGAVPVMIDAVSVSKAPRVARLLSKISILKTNRAEAAVLTGLQLDTETGVRCACAELLSHGVKQVFITLGADGVCAANNSDVFFVPALPVTVKNVTGAGDAFSAGIALYSQNDLLTQTQFGVACAALTLESSESVSPVLTRQCAEIMFNKDDRL